MNGCIYRTEDNKCKQFSVGGVLSFCYDGECDCKIPSNADRIRQMTEEKLAKRIVAAYGNGGVCPINHTHLYCCLDNGCVKCWISWLKAPVEEGKG